MDYQYLGKLFVAGSYICLTEMYEQSDDMEFFLVLYSFVTILFIFSLFGLLGIITGVVICNCIVVLSYIFAKVL